jgi:uncharacterized protein (DUF983 family)
VSTANPEGGPSAYPLALVVHSRTMRDPSDHFFTLLGRGFARRCPRCGGRDLFSRFLTMVEDCPTCGHHFEREQGYWIGAMIVATAFTLAGFLATFVGGLVITWPDVPWSTLSIAAIAVTGIVPVVTYSAARTVWVALDLGVRPMEADEIARANLNLAER